MSTIDKQAMRWLMLQSNRELDESERRSFEEWCRADNRHRGAYVRALAIDNALARATLQQNLRPARESLEAEWSGGAWRRNSRRTFLRLGGLAACITAMVGTGVFMLRDDASITTAKGEFRKVPLADHSIASINGGTTLAVKLGASVRQITLDEGEAWFEVAKDKSKPFIVEAGDVRVKAVGTAFAVRKLDDGSAEVLVTEGTVEVWSATGTARKRAVTVGEQAWVTTQAADITVDRRPDEIARKLAWREGKVIFVNQTLNEAVADFNRYSRKKIVIVDPSLGKKTLVGQYPINAPEVFAKDVGIFLNVPIVITGDQIIIGARKNT